MSKVTVDLNKRVQKLKVPNSFGQIICPCRILISASSGVGKSYFVKDLLRHRHTIFSENFSEIIIFMPNDGKIIDKQYVDELSAIVPSVRIVDDFSGNMEDYDLFKSSEIRSHRLVVFEDLIGRGRPNLDWVWWFDPNEPN